MDTLRSLQAAACPGGAVWLGGAAERVDITSFEVGYRQDGCAAGVAVSGKSDHLGVVVVDETWSRMLAMIAAGRLPIQRGDRLAWAAETERPRQDRRLFRERVEQIAAIFDELNRTLSSTQRR